MITRAAPLIALLLLLPACGNPIRGLDGLYRPDPLKQTEAQRLAYALHAHELASDLGVSNLELATQTPLVGPRTITPFDAPVTWEIRTGPTQAVTVEPLELTADSVHITHHDGRVEVALDPSSVPLLETLDRFHFRVTVTDTFPGHGDGTDYTVLWTIRIDHPPSVEIVGPTRLVRDHYDDPTSPADIRWTLIPDDLVTDLTFLAEQADVSIATTTNIAGLVQGVLPVGDLLRIDDQFNLVVFGRPAPGEAIERLAELPVRITNNPGYVEGLFQIEDWQSSSKHFGRLFAQAFYCVKVFITNNYTKPVTVSSGSITIPIQYAAKLSVPESLGGFSPPYINPLVASLGEQVYEQYFLELSDNTWVIWHEDRTPMDFSAVLSVFQFDQRNSGEQVFVNLLRFAGALAGAATAFIDSEDYAKFAAFFAGPATAITAELLLNELIESLEFMNTNALKETTTIPPGTTVARYVFFPRGRIYGVWGLDLPVRVVRVQESGGRRVSLDATVQTEQETAIIGTTP